MKRTLSFDPAESAGLRHQLETCLTGVFTDNKIGKYLQTGNTQTAPDFFCQPENVFAYPQIKLAYSIWSGMQATDRHAVLGKFQRLYSSFTSCPVSRNTLVFCSLFIHEFAGILAAATGNPD